MRKASAYFALAELDRRSNRLSPSSTIIGAPMGRADLQIPADLTAASTYHAHVAERDLTFDAAIQLLFTEKLEIYDPDLEGQIAKAHTRVTNLLDPQFDVDLSAAL